MYYIDQSCHDLKLYLLAQAVGDDQFQILQSDELILPDQFRLRACIIGSSHFWELIDASGQVGFSEVIACQSLASEQFLLQGNLHPKMKVDFPIPARSGSSDHWHYHLRVDFEDKWISTAGFDQADSDGLQLCYRFPASRGDTVENNQAVMPITKIQARYLFNCKTLPTMLADARMANTRFCVEVRTWHYYPQQQQLVSSCSTLTLYEQAL